jgi:hypothetical protein
MNIRRAPRFHHFWNLFSTMPPTKHTRKAGSPLIKWLTTRAQCDAETARLAFESAKQARYLIQHDGRWTYDANAGFDHWNKKPTAAPATAPPQPPATAPEPETLEAMAERLKAAYDAAKAEALTTCRAWPRMTKTEAMNKAAQLWPQIDNGQRAQLFRALVSAGALHSGPDWIQGAGAA